MSLPLRGERLVASVAVASGVLIAIGAFLPWLSLYAGLHAMRGVMGLYGRLLVAGGIGCVLAGVRHWRRPTPGLRYALAVFGLVLLLFTTWLTAQLFVTYHELRANQMLVPRLGPGLFFVLAGSLMLGAVSLRRGRLRV
ncbi:MAG TPA: hypothetical protein VM716_08840 [Gemmatimonadales bacterium]|nr:hypothetical protein [Gemmatimonadales bacterium]